MSTPRSMSRARRSGSGGDRKAAIESVPVDWLLEPDNPSVRYLTLVNLLHRKESDAEVRKARADIMKDGVVPRILSRQRDGEWGRDGRFYRDKYTGTVWQLIILAEHEADGTDPRVRAAAEAILRRSQDRDGHGFSYDERAGSLGGTHGGVIPCLTGNMVWSLVKLGLREDPRVARAIQWITTYQRFDDGDGDPPRTWPYDRYEMCWGRHTCHMGVVKALKALSAIPAEKRDAEAVRTIERAGDYILAHHVFRKSHDLSKTSKPGWRKLQFPLMYQTDVLEVVGILLDAGIRDARMQEAVDLIASKQRRDGRWNLEATFNGRFQVSVEAKDKPSKWITYRAARALMRYHAA